METDVSVVDEGGTERGEARADAAAVVPEPPREVTKAVRRHSWTEPRVRSWWLPAVIVLLVSAYFLASRYLTWRRDLAVIRHGTVIDAYVYSADGYPIPGRRRPPSSVVELHYEVGGKQYKVEGFLRGRTESFVVQTYVPIRVDPGNPERWTARTEPAPLLPELLGGLMLLPVAAVLGAVALWQRARLVRLWRFGRSVEAVVMDSRQTALAPRSRYVRCAPVAEGAKQVYGVYVPDRAGRVAGGDWVGLVVEPVGQRSAVAALWMQ